MSTTSHHGWRTSTVGFIAVTIERNLKEIWVDISLNVKGMRNLQESFRDYVQVEMLEGDNKYQAEGYGLQDAKKGITFLSFPPVLHIQLKRFEYDMLRDAMVKVCQLCPQCAFVPDYCRRSTIVTNSPLTST